MFSSAVGHSLSARLNHLSLGRTLDEEDEEVEDGEERVLKLRDEAESALDSIIMWRLFAKNSVIICSVFAASDRKSVV